MMKVTLTFVYEKCWASMLVRQYNLIVRLLSTDLIDPINKLAYEYVEIIGENKNISKALNVLKEYPDIIDYKILKESENGERIIMRVYLKLLECPLFRVMNMFSQNKNLPIFERVMHDGSLCWNLETRRKNTAKRVVNKLKKLGIHQVNIRFRRERELSSKTLYILKYAYEKGYFDIKRRITLKELSHELNIPVSTLDTILRRAVKKVMDEMVK